MTDAIKRGAEAFRDEYSFRQGDADYVARAALTAALSDREGMARAMYDADGFHSADTWDTDNEMIKDLYRAQVDALRAHLLGGEA